MLLICCALALQLAYQPHLCRAQSRMPKQPGALPKSQTWLGLRRALHAQPGPAPIQNAREEHESGFNQNLCGQAEHWIRCLDNLYEGIPTGFL